MTLREQEQLAGASGTLSRSLSVIRFQMVEHLRMLEAARTAENGGEK